MIQTLWCYTATHFLVIPDLILQSPDPAYRYTAIRGDSVHLAVLENDKPIGFIDARTLGHESAKAWQAANYQPAGPLWPFNQKVAS
jgi:hypothetical protein